MTKPPASGPHSDITGADRDWSFGKRSDQSEPHPTEQVHQAREQSSARPDRQPPLGDDEG